MRIDYAPIPRMLLLFGMILLLSLFACTPAPAEPDAEDTRAVSIVRICEQTGVSIDQARELLDLLEALGYTGEVLFAYPATDDDDREYYHVWIGERTVDVYYAADGQIAAIKQGGILLYGDEQTPANGSGAEASEPDESTPSEQTPADMTLSLEDVSAQVAAGGEAFVRAHGRAGEQYRITVYLKSGASTAKGLEVQTADADGGLSWNWKISARTTPGDYRIVIERISDGRDVLELPFTVLPKAEQ